MSRTKLALLTAATTLSALAWGSCLLGSGWYQRVLQYVAVGSIFD
jgi:hypothetical protein